LGEDLKKIKDELEIVFFQRNLFYLINQIFGLDLNKLEEAKRDYKQFCKFL